ncbi:hypothetical protein CDL15_Pgr002599 [Punica granatum]|uniref:Uncharacterized protein n=1 Tax=Punica granatum TaxID=22663 RepID=A0A218XI64_PUNGR|nr:hypothetical protein CDL15_Pgr002599 [Punica granatum]
MGLGPTEDQRLGLGPGGDLTMGLDPTEDERLGLGHVGDRTLGLGKRKINGWNSAKWEIF